MKSLTIATIIGAALFGASAAAQATAVPTSVRLTISLRLRAPAALAALIDAQSDPRSPQYAHFLTSAQFRAAFAPTAQTYATTIALLRTAGFRIEQTSVNRTLIDVSAPPAIVTHTFGAPLKLVSSPYVTRYVASAPLRIPSGWSAVAAAIGAAPAPARRNAAVATATARPAASPTILYGPDGGFSPNYLSALYDFPGGHGFNGTGVKVADTIDDADTDANVDFFLKTFGITRVVPTSVIIGGGEGADTEQPDIDAEWTLGVAPGAAYYVYATPFLFNEYILDLFTQLVSDNIVDVVNTSFAACELDDTLELALEPVLAQGAAQGIAFEGVQFGTPTTCDYKGIDPIMVPGGDVNSLAVGASNAIADPSGALTAQSGLPASGGGVSLIVPLPAFQNGISGINPAGRNTPDLVLAGEVNSVGPSAYFTAENFGGPSGPPGWNGGFVFANNAPAAGMLADLQQMVHHRLGAFNRTLYRLFGADGYGAAFSDITSGCDGLVGSTPLCARQGYDVTSGIGSVDVYRLGKLLH